MEGLSGNGNAAGAASVLSAESWVVSGDWGLGVGDWGLGMRKEQERITPIAATRTTSPATTQRGAERTLRGFALSTFDAGRDDV